MALRINSMMDSYLSEVQARKRKERLRAKTSQMLRRISERIKKDEQPDTVADPFAGVPGHVKPLPQEPPRKMEVIPQEQPYVALHNLQKRQEPLPQHHEGHQKTLPKDWTKESAHLLMEKEEELRHLEEQVESKLNMLMEQRNLLSRKIRDVEGKEAELRSLEQNIRRRQTAVKKDDVRTGQQRNADMTPLEKTLNEVEKEQGFLQSREEDLIVRKANIEKEIRQFERRIEELRSKELSRRMHMEVFTKNQIAEFVDYVKDLIAMGEYEKARKLHEMAQSMLLSADLPAKEERRLKEILGEQYRSIHLAMLDLKKDN